MYTIEAKTHPINSHPQITETATTFAAARKVGKQLGNQIHIQQTTIRSQKTGRIWINFWPMYVGQ